MKQNERFHEAVRAFIFGFIFVVGFIGFKIVIPLKKVYSQGAPHTSKLNGKNLIICNHQEWTDILTVYLLYHRTSLRILATTRIFANKTKAKFLRFMGVIPVDRQNVDFSPISSMIEQVNKGKTGVIFPEGGLEKNGGVAKFKNGTAMIAALTHAAVIPHFKSTYRAFHKTYVGVGKPIYYYDYFDTYNAKNVQAFTDILEDEVKKLKVQVEKELWQKKNTSIRQ